MPPVEFFPSSREDLLEASRRLFREAELQFQDPQFDVAEAEIDNFQGRGLIINIGSDAVATVTRGPGETAVYDLELFEDTPEEIHRAQRMPDPEKLVLRLLISRDDFEVADVEPYEGYILKDRPANLLNLLRFVAITISRY